MASTNQNVSFVGFITRKEKDTGVNLRAKIVTPNKKRSLEKLVRVKIKANALDDYSCCVIDHAATKKRIEKSQDLNAVVNSFSFLFNGENQTTISYEIEKFNETSTIDQYLNNNGELIRRPLYNPDATEEATGYIRITVRKNDAEVSSRIMVKVKAMTAEEVLNSDKVYGKDGNLETALWNKIKGSNSGYQDSGVQKISSTLKFKQAETIKVQDISTIPISCTWSVEDYLAENVMKNNGDGFSGLYQLENGEKSRICMDKSSSNYGCIFKPGFKVTLDFLHNYAEFKKEQENEITGRYFILGNNDISDGRLILTATLRLGENSDVTKTIKYNCTTVSEYMDEDEVANFIDSVMKINVNGREVPWSKNDSLNDVIEIKIPKVEKISTEGTEQKVSFYGLGHFSALPESELKKLALDRTTLSNVLSYTQEIGPVLYKVEKNSDNYRVLTDADENPRYNDAYNAIVNRLFEGVDEPYFESVGTTIGDSNIASDIKVLTIPIGNPSGENDDRDACSGLYQARNIVNNYAAKLGAFAIKFSIRIAGFNMDEGKGTQVLDYCKIFVLTDSTT